MDNKSTAQLNDNETKPLVMPIASRIGSRIILLQPKHLYGKRFRIHFEFCLLPVESP